MAYENINVSDPHMTVANGYFYEFDRTSNCLIEKTSDGERVFLYVIKDSLGNRPVKSLEYDGFYFWTLQDGYRVDYDLLIKKWRINNYFCELENEINLTYSGSGHRYDSDAFTLEHYHTSFSVDVSGGSNYVRVNHYYDDCDIVTSGTVFTLGPNSNGYYEQVTITGSIGGDYIGLSSPTAYDYESGDKVNFNKYIWLFNNYNVEADAGALYKFDSESGDYIEKFADSEYKNVLACTFAKTTEISHVGTVNSLIYVKATNLKFLNVYSDPFSTYCVMTMDNLSSDGFDVYPIYDLVVYGGSVYRLQKKAMYYGSDYSWSNYNYQMSPIRNFIDSITVGAYPTILPATGMNKSKITASVHDQYAQPSVLKPVSFYDNDSVGYMLYTEVYTDSSGVSESYYVAGITPATVTIEAIVTQYD
jgi:hypothetical protein